MSQFDEASVQKTQPWRQHWPPITSVDTSIMAGYKAGESMAVDGSDGSGAFGYNDKGQGVAPPNEGEQVALGKEKFASPEQK